MLKVVAFTASGTYSILASDVDAYNYQLDHPDSELLYMLPSVTAEQVAAAVDAAGGCSCATAEKLGAVVIEDKWDFYGLYLEGEMLPTHREPKEHGTGDPEAYAEALMEVERLLKCRHNTRKEADDDE